MDVVRTFCTSSLLEQTGMSSSSSFFHWHSLSFTSSSVVQAVPTTRRREKTEVVACNSAWAIEQILVSWESCLLIMSSLYLKAEYLIHYRGYKGMYLRWAYQELSSFWWISLLFLLISLWDLWWVETGLWWSGKRELRTEDQSHESVDAVCACTQQDILQASNELSDSAEWKTHCSWQCHERHERLLFQNVCEFESPSVEQRK